MKKRTKVLLLLLSAVLLVVASVFGTIAYLTDKDNQVTNTFTVGKVEITLDEAKVDVYGVKANPEVRTSSNAYKLIPGHTYTKDPKIQVLEGSEECYLFVKVENGLVNYEMSANTIESQMTAKGWKAVDGNKEPGVYYYYGSSSTNGAVSEKTSVEVFNTFTIDEKADSKNGWKNIDTSKPVISVTAYAIQADGFKPTKDNPTDEDYAAAIKQAWNKVK